jgi:lipoprotein-releasing system permease protein
MRLLIYIAWTHISTRIRQTIVGVVGVSAGVGFTIMMASVMQGSQIDFIQQLVDTLPHITVSDERRFASAQPAEQEYAAVQMSNVAAKERRSGIKYPYAVISSLESWVPGTVTPSVKTTAVVNHRTGNFGVTLVGIDPRREAEVSKLASQMKKGQLSDLSKAPNGIIIGDALAQKIAAQLGGTISLSGGAGIQISATLVGIFRSGLKQVDESQIYSLMNVAQVFVGQTGLVNQLRLRLHDPLAAREIATRVEAQIGYKSVSWQEANSNFLSNFALRNFIAQIVMGAMLLVSSFATYNIISTITHEKRHDIAIMMSLGMKEHLVRGIFIIESAMIGVVGMLGGWVLGFLLCIAMSQYTWENVITGETVPLNMYYSSAQYIVTGAISIVCCAVAAYFPARKATRVHPVEIIRGAS